MTPLFSALTVGAHLILGGSDCQVTSPLVEDGTAYAQCADATTWVYDADGQPYANDAGVPVREPGWYEVTS